jgi:hypothetical protein
LVLDKPYYLSGEIVTGRVDLDVYHTIDARAVLIKWKGFERTLIENTVTVQTSNVCCIFFSFVHVQNFPSGGGLNFFSCLLMLYPQGTEQKRQKYKEDREFFKQVLTLYSGNAVLAPQYVKIHTEILLYLHHHFPKGNTLSLSPINCHKGFQESFMMKELNLMVTESKLPLVLFLLPLLQQHINHPQSLQGEELG